MYEENFQMLSHNHVVKVSTVCVFDVAEISMQQLHVNIKWQATIQIIKYSTLWNVSVEIWRNFVTTEALIVSWCSYYLFNEDTECEFHILEEHCE
jgi:hypothetical protein